MPVYDLSYRSYEGTLRRRGRWAVIVGQELRVLLSRKMFIFLVLLGNFHLFVRVLQIYVLDVLAVNPNASNLGGLSGVDFESTGAWLYFDFLRMQSPLLFLTLIYAGSGLICNDSRNNLMEVYFSKPIRWHDYAVGKIMSLVTIGMSLSALPALLMGGLHVLFTGTRAAFDETLSYVLPILLFSLMLVLSFSLVILASSCLINSAKFAGVSVIMITLINITLGTMLAGMLRDEEYLAWAYPVSVNRLGEILFHESRYQTGIDVPWTWCAAYVAAVCTAALGVICVKARRAESGR